MSVLPDDPQARKAIPIATCVLGYWPRAIVALAQLSYVGSQQHNPGEPPHWDRAKSTDEPDAAMRHFLERGNIDTDGQRHSVKALWRMMALVEKELEAAARDEPSAALPLLPKNPCRERACTCDRKDFCTVWCGYDPKLGHTAQQGGPLSCQECRCHIFTDYPPTVSCCNRCGFPT